MQAMDGGVTEVSGAVRTDMMIFDEVQPDRAMFAAQVAAMYPLPRFSHRAPPRGRDARSPGLASRGDEAFHRRCLARCGRTRRRTSIRRSAERARR